jgi:outer membrane protein assembly factor BamB/tetratricopeptide (TPR) repeat protein
MMERSSCFKQRWIGLAALATGTGLAAAFWLIGPIGRQATGQQPGQIQILPGGGLVQFGGGFRRFGIPGQPDSDESPDGAFLPVDRDTTRQWEKAKSLLKDGHYADAATLLDEILQRGDDYFFKPQPDKPNYQSLKTEAERLISEMPAEGRQAYELQFGSEAQRMLNAAAASGDVAALEDVARRYFHTKAGYQAALLLARHHLDHGHPLAAAVCLERLLESPQAAAAFEPMLSLMLAASWQRGGLTERAEETLLSLKKKDPHAILHVADKTVQLFSDDRQAIAWLESTVGKSENSPPGAMQQWTLVRGDAARNAASAGGMPLLNPLWRVSTTNHPTLEKTLGTIRQQYLDQGIAALPSMQPLAVGDLVLMRTARDLLAVDFSTGKRLWPVRSGSETSLEQMLSSTSTGDGNIDPQRNPALIERFCEDATFGTLSSDGRQVYLIDGLEANVSAADAAGPVMIGGGVIRGRIIFRGAINANGQIIIPKPFNKLTAHELQTQGKLKWEVGGASGEDEPQLAGAFFLGPPLPLEGKLYVLAEMKSSEIKLCVLDAKTGKLDWSQQVAIVEQNIQQDPLRRLAGCSPSYADGVLLCPTTAGAIVAIDVANRTLRWGYQYQRDSGVIPSNMVIMRGGGWQQFNNGGVQANPAERWIDSAITIAGNYALVTPLESNELHVLNLLDGKLLWKQARGDNLYVGGVHDGSAVLVGKHQVTLVKLADDKPGATKTVELPSGTMPSGRGFLSGDSYFLPLTSAEVAQIDLTSGKIVALAKSRSGDIPGNLICFQDQVISQGIDYVETFFQREPLEQRIAKVLKDKPDDTWALAHRGEIELDAGKLDSAIADLRRANKSSTDPWNRELLFQTLLAGVAQDFTKHRDVLPDLEELVQDDHQRGMYLRVLAAGLQQAGDISGALDADLKLAALELPSDELEELNAKLSVYRPRWVRAQFQELMAGAKGDVRTKIDAAMRQQLDQVIAAKNAKTLHQFVDCFGDHPAADCARELLLDELSGPETLLEREQLLLSLENSADPAQRTKAMAKLALLLQDAGQWEAALVQYRRLGGNVGNQPVWDGKNVKQLLASLPEGSPLRQMADQNHAWPTGEVKIEKPDANSRGAHTPNMTRVFSTQVEGKRGPFFSDVLLGRDLGRQEIVGVDGLGKEKFQIPLGGDANRLFAFRGGNIFGNNALVGDFAFVQGHILIVCTGYQVMALDTLKPVGISGSRILWTKDLGDPSLLNGNLQPLPRQPMPWGGMRRVQNQQTMFGDVELCGEHTLCFQHGHDVMAVDPLTGQTQWVRHGVENGCDLLGDEEMLVLAPPNGKKALVLRTADGELLCEKSVAPMDKRWTNYGYCILAFREQSDGNQITLALADPWTERDVWSESFSGWNNGQNPGVKGTLVDGETVAVMQADGRFVMLNLSDGHKLIDQRLEAEQNQQNMLQGIHVFSSPDQYLVMIDRVLPPGGALGPRGLGDARGSTSSPQAVIMSTTGEPMSQIVTGHVYAFDRGTGKAQWTGPAYVEQHGFLLGQPNELPVFTFIRNVQTFGVNRAQQMHGSVLCLDKRTGRMVYSDDDLPPLSGFDISGNLEDKTVALNVASLQNQAGTSATPIVLKFTDTPAASEAPFQAGAVEKSGSSTETKE